MSTGLRITQVVLLLIGVMTLYGCGSADNTDNNNNNMAEQNLSSTNNISNQEDNIRKNEYSGDNMQSETFLDDILKEGFEGSEPVHIIMEKGTDEIIDYTNVQVMNITFRKEADDGK